MTLTLVVFGVAVLLWVCTPLDDTFVALAAVAALLLFGVLPASALAALGSSTTWLLIAAFVLAAGVTASGLPARLATWLVGRARTVRGLAHLTALALLLTAFFVPSTSGRAALTLPVYSALRTHLNSRVARALGVLFPSVILLTAVATLVGAGAHLITSSLLETATGQGIGFGWWLLLGVPLAVVSAHLTAEIVLWLFTKRADRAKPLRIGETLEVRAPLQAHARPLQAHATLEARETTHAHARPLQARTMPLQVGVMPLQSRETLEARTPLQAHAMPLQSHMVSSQAGAMPPQSHMVSPQAGAMPPQSHMMSSQAGAMPPQSHMMPLQAGATPLQSHMVSPQAGAMPLQSRETLEARTPLQSHAMSPQAGATPPQAYASPLHIASDQATVELPVPALGRPATVELPVPAPGRPATALLPAALRPAARSEGPLQGVPCSNSPTQHRRFRAPARSAWSALTRAEWVALAVVLTVAAAWLTEPWHHIRPEVIALTGAIAITAPRLGTTTMKKAFADVPWSLLLFMAATTILGTALIESGAARLVAGLVDPAHLLPTVIVVSLLAHLVIQSRSARSSVLIPIVIPLAAAAGMNPVALAFASTAAAGFCHTLTSSAKPVALFADAYRPKDLLKLSAVLAPVTAALVFGFAVLVWPHLGLPLR